MQQTNMKRHEPINSQSMKCADCGKIWSSPEEMELHTSKIHGNREHLCEYCRIGYRCQEYLDMHVQGCHQLQCNEPECGQIFRDKKAFMAHRKNHTFNMINSIPLPDPDIKIETALPDVQIPFARIQLDFDSLKNIATDDRQPEEECLVANGNTADNEQLKQKQRGESTNVDNQHQAMANGGNETGGSPPKKRKVKHSKNGAIEKKHHSKHHSKHAKAKPVSSVSEGASKPKIINTGVWSSEEEKEKETHTDAFLRPLDRSSVILPPPPAAVATLAPMQCNPNEHPSTQPTTTQAAVFNNLTRSAPLLCHLCSLPYSSALDLQIHLNYHIGKFFLPIVSQECATECAQILDGIEMAGRRMRDLLRAEGAI